MSDGINVGDAVLTFIGDTQQLDETFASLPSKAKAGLTPVQEQIDGVTTELNAAGAAGDAVLGEQIPAAAELTRKEVSEARGEVRLLGEEFGIRLPRHVANFVAEMPGVGEALSAAFSATAVLFLVQALVQATEKVADFAGAMLIYTAADKAAHAALVANNLEIAKQTAAYVKAKEALDEFGKTAVEKTQSKIEELTKSTSDHSVALGNLTTKYNEFAGSTTQAWRDAMQGNILLEETTIKALAEELELQKKIIEQQKNEAALKSLKEEISLREKLTNVQITYNQALGLDKETADELRYQASLKALKAQADAEAKFGKDSVDRVKEINAQIEDLEVEHALKLKQEADKAAQDLEKTFAGIQKEVGKDTVGALQAVTAGLPPLVQGMLKMREAAKAAGVTLRSDLVAALNAAEIAKADFVNTMGTTDKASLAAFDAAIHKAQLSLKHFNDEAKKGKLLILEDRTAMDEFKTTSSQAAQQLGQNVSQAFSDMIDHQESFGKAMEKSTFEMLAKMAEQWGAFYIAKGIADIALDPAASAEELAGGFALEALGGVLSGLSSKGSGGGRSASSTQSQSSSVDTGGSTRSTIGITGVQKFAMGGLISQPTLAVIGENPGESEAVLPLDNEKAMTRIGQSIANSGGGGSRDIHVHVKGLVSPDTLHKVMGQINRRVAKGQGNLVSSNTFRVTKRSA